MICENYGRMLYKSIIRENRVQRKRKVDRLCYKHLLTVPAHGGLLKGDSSHNWGGIGPALPVIEGLVGRQ